MKENKKGFLNAAVAVIIALVLVMLGTSVSANYSEEEIFARNGTEVNNREIMKMLVFGLFPHVSGNNITYMMILPFVWHTIPKDKFTGRIGTFIIWGFYDPSPFEEEISTTSGCDCEGCEIEINFTSNPYSWGISLIIKNVGDSDCTDVKWKIVFDGGRGFILMPNLGFLSGSIPLLRPGESETINSGLIFGLGRTTVLGWADSYEGSPVWDNMEFKIFLFFIKIL